MTKKQKKTKDTEEKTVEALYEELERKDRQIEKLKEENAILMKTALRAQERVEELLDKEGRKES